MRNSLYLALALGALTTLGPFVLMASTGLKGPTDQNDNRVLPKFLSDDEELLAKVVDDEYAGDRPAIDARTDSAADPRAYERDLEGLPPDRWKAAFQMPANGVTGRLRARYQDWLRERYRDIDALNVPTARRRSTAEIRRESATRNLRYVLGDVLLNGRALWVTFAFCGLAVLAALVVNPRPLALPRARLGRDPRVPPLPAHHPAGHRPSGGAIAPEMVPLPPRRDAFNRRRFSPASERGNRGGGGANGSRLPSRVGSPRPLRRVAVQGYTLSMLAALALALVPSALLVRGPRHARHRELLGGYFTGVEAPPSSSPRVLSLKVP